MQVSNYQDYRVFLKDVLAQRARANPRYSLRAFARDLALTPPRLSEVLSRKKGLSIAAASEVSQKLSLSGEETSYFCDLVQMADARSAGLRQIAKMRVERSARKDDFHELHSDVLNVISDWHHFAILELTHVEDFKSDVGWIARTLGISRIEAQNAIDRLVRLELLASVRGRLKKTQTKLTTTKDIPSASIREFNRQVLNKALLALEAQPVDQRDFSTMTMAIDSRKIPEAKKLIRDFRRQLAETLEAGRQDKVYCLAIQLFNLSY